MPRETTASYLRNFIFGVEDSLVSTVGLLSGIAVAAVERETIILTGLVLIFVEAFSMGIGSFLSEHSAEDFVRQRETSSRPAVVNGLIMFISYFLSGFIPLLPYILFQISQAPLVSIGLSLTALFFLGVIGAQLSKISIWGNGLRMLVVGGVAIGVGIAVGQLINP